MSKSNIFENQILRGIFQNIKIDTAGTADGSGSFSILNTGTSLQLRIALYTANPGEGVTLASTNEANYTGYARVLVQRSSAGWTVTNGVASNAAKITFPACTAGSNTITHFGILSVGADPLDDVVLFYGQLTTPLNVSVGITPEFNIGTLTVTEE